MEHIPHFLTSTGDQILIFFMLNLASFLLTLKNRQLTTVPRLATCIWATGPLKPVSQEEDLTLFTTGRSYVQDRIRYAGVGVVILPEVIWDSALRREHQHKRQS